MKDKKYPIIGILGGMGPYAGVDLMKKIFRNTKAVKDQEHIPVHLTSIPHEIVGRPDFLLGLQPINPGYSMGELMLDLEKAGATHVAVPCNTAHAPSIWKLVDEALERENSHLVVVHIFEELKKEMTRLKMLRREKHMLMLKASKKEASDKDRNRPLRMGILATSGTIKAEIYEQYFGNGYELVYPTEAAQAHCMDAIYNPEYGFKAISEDVTEEARQVIDNTLRDLKEQDVDVFILGCSELSFALTKKKYYDIPCIDPVNIQARALIRATYPEKLV